MHSVYLGVFLLWSGEGQDDSGPPGTETKRWDGRVYLTGENKVNGSRGYQ